MPANLTDENISDTYGGLLHVQGTTLPLTGQVVVSDGDGKTTSMSLGVSGEGVTVTGPIVCTSLSASATIDASTIVSQETVSNNTAKAWVLITGNDGTRRNNYNVGSVIRTAPGDYTISFTQALTSAEYTVLATVHHDNNPPNYGIPCVHVKSVPAQTINSFSIKTLLFDGSSINPQDFARVSVAVYHS